MQWDTGLAGGGQKNDGVICQSRGPRRMAAKTTAIQTMDIDKMTLNQNAMDFILLWPLLRPLAASLFR